MAENFDLAAALGEVHAEYWATPPSSYGPIDFDRNRVAVWVDPEMLDRSRVMREINKRMQDRLLEAALSEVDKPS